MRRRMLAIGLALVLVLVILGTVFASDDAPTHWADATMERAAELGLLKGVAAEDCAPDAAMSRAAFVTALGSLAGIDPGDWDCAYLCLLFTDIDPAADYTPYLAWAAHAGIVKGASGGAFCPDKSLTREQMAHMTATYLAVSGLTVSIPERPVLQTGSRAGQKTEETPAETAEAPLTVIVPEGEEPVPTETEAPQESALARRVREQAERYAVNRERTLSLSAQDGPALERLFADAEEISGWARQSVQTLAGCLLVSGIEGESGQMLFAPKRAATVAECATLLCRLADQAVPAEEVLEPTSIILNAAVLTLDLEEQAELLAVVFPYGVTNENVLWYSEEPEIATVSQSGVITAVSPGMTAICAVTANRLLQSCIVKVNEPPAEPEPEPEPEIVLSAQEPVAPGLLSGQMSDHEKDLLVFGQDVSDPRLFYETDEEALSHQVGIAVRTWVLADDGTKYTRTWGLQVHENIAPTVQAIFEEIYALPEQPVIHSMGGWRPNAGKSEHHPGLAIDINWLENAFFDANGKIITGYYYKPGEDPYSIPIGGSIDQIFAKYGFTRGIYWHNGTKDYMHYSLYGT